MAKRILIVDDDKTLLKLVSSYLTEQGYEIVTAHDGEEGLERLQRDLPDLVVLDVVMPKVNGYSFLFDMRKLEQGAQTPVIVLTCKEKLEDIFKVEGVKEFLIKPFPNSELLAKIRKYI